MKTIEEIEIYAKENFIPIARKEVVSFLISIIKQNNYKNILEVGSAIGYTTLQLASLPDVYVSTYEYWPPRIEICKQNINDFHLENKIDFHDYDVTLFPINQKFDLIFIDGAKAKTIKLFEFLKDNINENGIIVIDNINLEIVNQIELKNKKKKYQQIVIQTKQYFENLSSMNVKYFDIGDGLYVINNK